MRIWTATVQACQRCSVERSSINTIFLHLTIQETFSPKPAYRQFPASLYPLVHISLRKRTFHAKRCHCSPARLRECWLHLFQEQWREESPIYNVHINTWLYWATASLWHLTKGRTISNSADFGAHGGPTVQCGCRKWRPPNDDDGAQRFGEPPRAATFAVNEWIKRP